MRSKPKKKSGFSKESLEVKLKDLGYVGLLKSISPYYSKDAEEVRISSKLKVFNFLLKSNPPEKDVLEEAMHFFAGYDRSVTSVLILCCAHEVHQYDQELIPFLFERIESVRPSLEEADNFRLEFLKESSDLAAKLFLNMKNPSKSFLFGVDVIDFLEKRVIFGPLLNDDSVVEEVIVSKEKQVIAFKEKPRNCFQNGFEKHVTPKRRTIIRKIDFKRAPKRTYQKVMSN